MKQYKVVRFEGFPYTSAHDGETTYNNDYTYISRSGGNCPDTRLFVENILNLYAKQGWYLTHFDDRHDLLFLERDFSTDLLIKNTQA